MPRQVRPVPCLLDASRQEWVITALKLPADWERADGHVVARGAQQAATRAVRFVVRPEEVRKHLGGRDGAIPVGRYALGRDLILDFDEGILAHAKMFARRQFPDGKIIRSGRHHAAWQRIVEAFNRTIHSGSDNGEFDRPDAEAESRRRLKNKINEKFHRPVLKRAPGAPAGIFVLVDKPRELPPDSVAGSPSSKGRHPSRRL